MSSAGIASRQASIKGSRALPLALVVSCVHAARLPLTRCLGALGGHALGGRLCLKGGMGLGGVTDAAARDAHRSCSAIKLSATAAAAIDDDVARRIRSADVVCFDVDSTVLTVEGIDELASLAGVKDDVQKLTSSAMDGAMTFHASLTKRLEIIRPSRALIAQVLASSPPSSLLSPRVGALIDVLHERNVAVYLVSGGFKEMIDPLATALGIPTDRVYANTLRFNAHGEFASFDPQAWTATSGGVCVCVYVCVFCLI